VHPTVDGVAPPNAKADVLKDPAPAKIRLAVIKEPPVDHDDPLYDSVAEGYPPNAKADVLVPAPAKNCLPVDKLLTCDHVDPLYSSVQDT